MRFSPSTIPERSPGWAPWESHPDPRRSVGSVLDGRHVIAATTSAPVGVALAKAVLDTNIRSISATHGGYNPSTTEVGDASCDRPSPVASPAKEDRRAKR